MYFGTPLVDENKSFLFLFVSCTVEPICTLLVNKKRNSYFQLSWIRNARVREQNFIKMALLYRAAKLNPIELHHCILLRNKDKILNCIWPKKYSSNK